MRRRQATRLGPEDPHLRPGEALAAVIVWLLLLAAVVWAFPILASWR